MHTRTKFSGTIVSSMSNPVDVCPAPAMHPHTSPQGHGELLIPGGSLGWNIDPAVAGGIYTQRELLVEYTQRELRAEYWITLCYPLHAIHSSCPPHTTYIPSGSCGRNVPSGSCGINVPSGSCGSNVPSGSCGSNIPTQRELRE